MKVAFLTLGCKVNFYETEKMSEQFRQKGFDVVDFQEEADIYVVNTCTVTNIADRKSRQMLHRAKKKNPDSFVVAVGCYVESGGEELLADKAVDAAFSNKEKESVAERIIERFYAERPDYRMDTESCTTGIDRNDVSGKSVTLQHDRTRAYLKIQDGCNQFCTYCMIPYVRGRGVLRSTPSEEVVLQVEELAAQGYKEVVLTGIHLSSYGVDLELQKESEYYSAMDFIRLEGMPLIRVMREVSKIEGIERIRLGSMEPRIITEKFLMEITKLPKVCPHFHLSLQSGCDSVLRRMNRHYTTVEYKEKVDLLRKYYENPAITTDVIVGFPGETEEEFEQTISYLKEIELADIHVFKYSERTGTPAAAMKDQVRPEVKNQRSDRLIADTEQYRKKFGSLFTGKREKVLFEETSVENGIRYLAGHNERYVKIGVLYEEAREKGYLPNAIHEIVVEKILSK